MTKGEIALSLLAQGFSVIPLWPKSKQAMVPWVEYQARHATPEQVREWWTAEPEANIGLITGAISGVIVGDVDPRHGGSVEETQRTGPSDYVVTTPGGGAHFYYKHPGGRVPKGKPKPGIDRQSDGGYVVAAGSYVVTDNYEGEYHQLKTGVPSSAPAWLLGEPVADQHVVAGDAWIAETLARGCPAGTRNDTLARLAGYLAGKSVPADVAHTLLWRWVREQDGTHVTAAECARTIESIYAKEKRSRPAPATGYVVDEFVQEATDQPLQTMMLSEFGALFFDDKVEWLIPEWLPAKSIAFLVSPPGRFKTMLTFDVAISVAGGWPFLGTVSVANPGPVLVIQQEDDYGDMARRFNRIFAARQPGRRFDSVGGEMVSDHLAVCDLPPVHICTTRGFTLGIENLRRLEDLIRRIRPRVVIIDPLYSITSAEDFMMHAAKDMMPLKRLRDVYGVTFLIAAHTKKGADVGREGLWGSQFLNAFLETGWQIRDREGGEANQVQLQRHFKSAAIPANVNVEFLLDEQEGYKVVLTDPDADGPQDAVLAALATFPEGAAAPVVAERSGLGLRQVQKRLKKFKDQGLVVETPTGYKIPKDTTKEV